ncbi:hypothetical protein MHEI_43850 [Mycobacterium heidelbergense]|nr:hypothetical protein MHEI_43850 [Mycobacterium heidelbergense]
MTGLRGEAAIVGIAELPAERRPTGPPMFTLDQYALLAKMVVEDAGVDAACVTGNGGIMSEQVALLMRGD